MNFDQRQKCVQRRILSAHKERREPRWTQITIQRSNSKALLIWGGRKFLEEKRGKKPCCLYEMMYLKDEEGKKSRGWIFTGLFGVASVSLGNRDETARFLYHHTVEMALFCCFFFFFSFFKCDTGWTQYRRILSCVCLVKDSVTEKSEKCGETRTWSR